MRKDWPVLTVAPMPSHLRVQRVRARRAWDNAAAWFAMGLALGLIVAAFVWAHGQDQLVNAVALERELGAQSGMDVAAAIARDCTMPRGQGKIFLPPWHRNLRGPVL